ncbi:hypothetical protein [Cupriavidus sp. D384]|uniref:hypothetical protein n=1 Tax=Cupriavidus sp. D384 TaxID=1538095 RepID=UPI000A70D502|nr:hypothetical protein [Cupriavidus sp. D384]
MQPPPPLFETWAKPGASQQVVRSALLECGFPDAAHVTPVEMARNDYARAQLCMLDHGFTYTDRSIVCAHAPELPACADVPRGKTFGTDADFDPALLDQRPRLPPAYTQWSRPGTDIAGVRQAMTACGYTTLIQPADFMKLNDIAAAQLCMIDRQFRFARPASSLLCRNPPALPACRDRKIDLKTCCGPMETAGGK